MTVGTSAAAPRSLRFPLATSAALWAELFHLVGDRPWEVDARSNEGPAIRLRIAGCSFTSAPLPGVFRTGHAGMRRLVNFGRGRTTTYALRPAY